MSKTSKHYTLGYDELSQLINKAYEENQDLRTIGQAFDISVAEVFEITGWKDYYDFEKEGG